MKKLLLLLLLSSCTLQHQSDTAVICPCIITQIKIYVNQNDKFYNASYKVVAQSVDHPQTFFTFETSHRYNLTDTIK